MLSLIILLDQFTRNIFRNTSEMFDGDKLALSYSHQMITKKWDHELLPIQRTFVYLPLEHSENLDDQELSVQKFTELVNDPSVYPTDLSVLKAGLDYAIRHKTMIERFGRYPYRNAILGRPSTKEEEEFLNNGGESFIYGNQNKK
jgi:uncharacterized protein (DUF924 family)